MLPGTKQILIFWRDRDLRLSLGTKCCVNAFIDYDSVCLHDGLGVLFLKVRQAVP